MSIPMMATLSLMVGEVKLGILALIKLISFNNAKLAERNSLETE